MANKKNIYFSFILLALSLTGYAQFTPKQEAEIKKKARKTLDEYVARANKLGKEVKKIDQTRLNIEDFLGLFVTRKTQIYNDLDPTHTLSKNYEAETYAANIPLWYPSGLIINLLYTDAQVSNVISHEENVYSIDYIVDKQIDGSYLGKTKNDTIHKLQFRIAFTLSAGVYTNFKIAGIRMPEQKEIASNKEILEINSATLTTDDKRDIERETRSVLNDYANYLSLIGDTLENIEEKILYKNSFKALFTRDQCPVFNDILPDSKKQFVPVSDYIVLYSEAYAADGGTVTFELDSADLGYVIKRNDSLYYRNTEVNKFFKGNYLGKRKVILNNRVALRIVFLRSGRLFKNFKIERIDQVNRKKAETIEQRTFTSLQKQKIDKKPGSDKHVGSKPLKPSKSKISIEIGASGNLTNLFNRTLNEVTEAKSGYKWNTTPLFGYSVYAHYLYMLTPKFSLLTGIGYSTASTRYSVKTGNFITDNNTIYTDKLGGKYIKELLANFDSTIELSFINIPIGVSINFNLSQKIDLVVKPTINMNIVAKANSKFQDSLIYYAYYQNQTDIFHPNVAWPTSLQLRKDWPEFGVYQNISKQPRKTDIKESLNSLHIVAGLSCGINLKLNTKNSITLSGNIQSGLNDINKLQPENVFDFFGETEEKKTESFIYGQSDDNLNHMKSNHKYTYKPTILISYGIGLEYILKF